MFDIFQLATGRKRPLKPIWGELVIPKGLVQKWQPVSNQEENYYNLKRDLIQQLDMDVVVIAPTEPQPQSAGCQMEGKEAFVDYGQRYFVEVDDSRLYLGSGIELKRGVTLESLPRLAQFDFGEFEFWENQPQTCWAMINGPITETMYYTGFEAFLAAVHEDAESVTGIMNQVMRFQVELAKRAISAGAKAIILADDFAFTHGLMINKEIFSFYLLSIFQSALQELHALEVPVLLHCDGNLADIVDELVTSGFDGFQSLEWLNTLELEQLAKQYPDTIFMGNLPPELLTDASCEDQLRGYLQKLIQVSQRTGNLILSTSSGLSSEMSINKLFLMSELLSQEDG